MKGEARRVPLIDINAQHIGRQQIAGELDALEIHAQQARKQMRQGGLADTRQILDEQMAARQEAGQRQTDLGRFAEHHLLGGFHHHIQTGAGGVAAGGRALAQVDAVF